MTITWTSNIWYNRFAEISYISIFRLEIFVLFIMTNVTPDIAQKTLFRFLYTHKISSRYLPQMQWSVVLCGVLYGVLCGVLCCVVEDNKFKQFACIDDLDFNQHLWSCLL